MNANAMKQESSLVDSNGNGSSTPKRGWVRTEQGWEPLDPRMQQIVFQIRAGRPYKEIAEQFSLTISRISKIRDRADIPRRVEPR